MVLYSHDYKDAKRKHLFLFSTYRSAYRVGLTLLSFWQWRCSNQPSIAGFRSRMRCSLALSKSGATSYSYITFTVYISALHFSVLRCRTNCSDWKTTSSISQTLCVKSLQILSLQSSSFKLRSRNNFKKF